jgi:hypothetical protein
MTSENAGDYHVRWNALRVHCLVGPMAVWNVTSTFKVETVTC